MNEEKSKDTAIDKKHGLKARTKAFTLRIVRHSSFIVHHFSKRADP